MLRSEKEGAAEAAPSDDAARSRERIERYARVSAPSESASASTHAQYCRTAHGRMREHEPWLNALIVAARRAIPQSAKEGDRAALAAG